MTYTVKVARVPGQTKEVAFDNSITVDKTLEIAGVILGKNDEVRVNGTAVAGTHLISGNATLIISRVIKSNA